MLYFKIDGAAVQWNGELISDIRYPRNIEVLWSDAELAEIGLFHPLPADPAPPGKIAVGETVQIVGDNVKVVLTLEDEPPPPPPPPPPSTDPADYPLSMRQLRLGLVENGFGAGFIPAAIAAMPPGIDRDRATVWYEETKTGVQWNHPMTQALIAASGLTTEQAAAMWMAAKDLEA